MGSGELGVGGRRFLCPAGSRSCFFLPPNKEENKPDSFSFLVSLAFRLLSFFRSSSNFMSPRSRTRLSLPRAPLSTVCCNKSSLTGLSSFCLSFLLFASRSSSSFLRSFSFSSLPSKEPQLQLDFFVSFLGSDLLSSVKVGIKERLSVRVLLPGNGDGCAAIC